MKATNNNLRVKHFDSITYNDKVLRGKNNIQEARYYINALKTFKGCNNIEDVEAQLLKQTGFKNARMASQAMDVEQEYVSVKNCNVEDFSIFNENYTELTDEFKSKLEKSILSTTQRKSLKN